MSDQFIVRFTSRVNCTPVAAPEAFILISEACFEAGTKSEKRKRERGERRSGGEDREREERKCARARAHDAYIYISGAKLAAERNVTFRIYDALITMQFSMDHGGGALRATGGGCSTYGRYCKRVKYVG